MSDPSWRVVPETSGVDTSDERDGAVGLERRRRMALVFEAGEPHETEIRAAYLRWLVKALPARARRRPTLRYVFVGLIAFATSAAAYQGLPRLFGSRSAPVGPRTSGGSRPAQRPAAAPRPAPISASRASGESSSPQSIFELAPARSAAHAGKPGEVRDSGGESGLLWRRAASALERREYAEAERVLGELARKYPSSGDAADLARAQVLIASHRESAARPVLERLAASGSSAVIRRRAQQLLRGK